MAQFDANGFVVSEELPAGTPVLTLSAPTAEAMRQIGTALARQLKSQDVVLLSGPLGAGKTTFAQGIGKGLGIDEPIVSPTFTIARELDGHFASGAPAHLVHVDAYRIGGVMHEPGNDTMGALMDELESLGLDEELEDPSEGTVVLMEWGEHMAGILADTRLEVHIHRSEGNDEEENSTELSADGERVVSIVGVGWGERFDNLKRALQEVSD